MGGVAGGALALPESAVLDGHGLDLLVHLRVTAETERHSLLLEKELVVGAVVVVAGLAPLRHRLVNALAGEFRLAVLVAEETEGIPLGLELELVIRGVRVS